MVMISTKEAFGCLPTGRMLPAGLSDKREIREIGGEAVWSLSTAKPGNGTTSSTAVVALLALVIVLLY